MNYWLVESIRLWTYDFKKVPNSVNKYQIVNTHEISKSPREGKYQLESMKPMSTATTIKHLAYLNLHETKFITDLFSGSFSF
jgi:hypothetical protein